MRILTSLGFALAILVGSAAARDGRAGLLSFETCGPSLRPMGWEGGPIETLFVDSTTVHGGRYSARIERGSEGEFSALRTQVPVDFKGDTLELRGWLRLEGVEGYAGLWLRQDAPGGVVQFDNMQQRKLAGTLDWMEYRIALPLDGKARTAVFGALLAGSGKLWVDDLQLLVDGRPFAEADSIERPQTAIDTDHQFDAGSKLEASVLSRRQVENLVLLGKVWGFLKYHHPKVTAAQVHWDYELFRIAPEVMRASDRGAATRALARWVAKLGDPPPCSPCAKLPADVHLSPQLEWIHDRGRLGTELCDRLQRVYAARDADGEQHYVSQTPNVRNPVFDQETAHPSPQPPDAGYRLLALFRFWNIVEYWFPYRDVMAEDWDGVLSEFLPQVFGASTHDDYQLAMMALVARVHDSHANLWSSLAVRPPRGPAQLPVLLRFVEDKAVVAGWSNDSLGVATGLHVGDVLVALDGTPVDSLLARWRPWYGASNEATQRRDLVRSLTRGKPGPCTVVVERDGKHFETTVERVSLSKLDLRSRLTHDRPGDTFQRPSDDVAYLKLSSVEADDTASYIQRASGSKCLVIDIRNYPSEFVVFALGQHLVTTNTEFARFTKGDLANPGAFTWTEPLFLSPAEPRYEGRVVILVDETTQSQAEYTTMALRTAPNAVVVGSTTAGADGNVSPIPLPGALRAMVSGIGVFYPDRRPTQRVGILPDLVVRPTLAGIRAGRDEVLEVALRHVLGREPTEAERLGGPGVRPSGN